MKITTKMKRNATGEWWAKYSKNITSSTKVITGFLDFDKPEPIYKKKKKVKKPKPVYEVWDTIRVRAISLYSPSVPKESVSFYSRREEALGEKFRELSRIWWLNYRVDLEITKVITEWKTNTYYGEYLWMEVAIDDHFNSIKKSPWI